MRANPPVNMRLMHYAFYAIGSVRYNFHSYIFINIVNN